MQTFSCFTGKASVGSVDIPIVLGTVKDEGTIFVYEAFPNPLSSAEEEGLFIETFGAKHVLKVGLKPVSMHMLVLIGKFVGKFGLFVKPAKENQ